MSRVLTADCRNVKSYLIECGEGWLMFDAGWPHLYSHWKDSVKEHGLRTGDIRHFIVSHFHIDHAGMAGLLQLNGAEFTIFDNQYEQINHMEELILRKGYRYSPIDREAAVLRKRYASREWLASIGLKGGVFQTFGHGGQGIALLLDGGEAFIGDLPVEYEYDETVMKDWDFLKSKGARFIYPAHAPYFELE